MSQQIFVLVAHKLHQGKIYLINRQDPAHHFFEKTDCPHASSKQLFRTRNFHNTMDAHQQPPKGMTTDNMFILSFWYSTFSFFCMIWSLVAGSSSSMSNLSSSSVMKLACKSVKQIIWHEDDSPNQKRPITLCSSAAGNDLTPIAHIDSQSRNLRVVGSHFFPNGNQFCWNITGFELLQGRHGLWTAQLFAKPQALKPVQQPREPKAAFRTPFAQHMTQWSPLYANAI